MTIHADIVDEKQLISLCLPQKYLRFRRVFDIIFVILISPLAVTIGIIAAILIKIDSRGPVFFIQRRPGKNGTFFNMYKFRTMTVVPKGKEDWTSYKHRITHIGAFLRKYRVDELPQIINVFKGEMSMVGPRPEPAEYFIECTNRIPFYKYRFMVTPGITGWSQVQFRHTDDIEGARIKLDYDLYYLNNISYKLDLMILLKTIKVVIVGEE